MIIDPLKRFGEWEWIEAGRPAAIATPSTGTNHIDLKFFQRMGVEVFSLLDDREGLETIRASSEYTFLAILLSLRKKAINADERQKPGRELYEKTVGLVGLGRIGRNLRDWCSIFGAHILFYDPYVKGYSSPLVVMFRACNIIVLCCSLTKETKGMVNKNLLDLCREGTIIVNTARGEIVVEKDMLDFLSERKDVTYFADVWEKELDGYPNPFYGLPNTITSNHEAGNCLESNRKAHEIAERLLQNRATITSDG